MLVRPRENSEFDVDASTQWMHHVQLSLSKVTGLPRNKFNIKVGINVCYLPKVNKYVIVKQRHGGSVNKRDGSVVLRIGSIQLKEFVFEKM